MPSPHGVVLLRRYFIKISKNPPWVSSNARGIFLSVIAKNEAIQKNKKEFLILTGLLRTSQWQNQRFIISFFTATMYLYFKSKQTWQNIWHHYLSHRR